MKIIYPAIFTSFCAMVLVGLFMVFRVEQLPKIPDPFSQLHPEQSCSVIYTTDGEKVLAGNNEDFLDPLTKVWFIPAGVGSYGKVYFGFENYHAQGGMNDQGLFFDALTLDGTHPISTTGKQAYLGNLVDMIMSECGTVDCVMEMFEHYYSSEVWFFQFFFGDAAGRSVIVEPQTMIDQQGSYQVATNFLQSGTAPEDLSDPRYREAMQGLGSMQDLTVDSIRDILDSIHLEGPTYTLYSNIYDLKDKIVYLYYFHNYEDVVVLDLEEELAQGYHVYDLPSLFPANQEAQSWAAPKLRKYENLIKSRLDDSVPQDILQAYEGEYQMLEGWGDPDQTLQVITREGSLFLRFPDYHQHELFPASPTDFYYVAFLGTDFTIAYDVRFGLDKDGSVRYLELILGAQISRANWLGPQSFVPSSPTPTLPPTLTVAPTQTPEPFATQTVTQTITISDTPIPTALEVARAVTVASEGESPDLVEEIDEGNNRMILSILIGALVIAVVVGVWIFRSGR